MKRSLFVGLSMFALVACDGCDEEKKQVKFQRVCIDPEGYVVPEDKCNGVPDSPQSTPPADSSSPVPPASVSPPAPSGSVGYGVTGGWIGPPTATPEHHDTAVVVIAQPTPVYHWWYSSGPYVHYSPGSRVIMTSRTGSFTPAVGRVYSSPSRATTVMGARGGVAVSRGFVGGSFRGGTVSAGS